MLSVPAVFSHAFPPVSLPSLLRLARSPSSSRSPLSLLRLACSFPSSSLPSPFACIAQVGHLQIKCRLLSQQ
eukprot:515527-Rhodomonas_salina.3